MSAPDDPQLQVATSLEGTRLVATVTGEIDAASADSFESQLIGALTDASSVVLDLSGVSFMDSSGLRALMAIHSDVTSRDGRIELSATSSAVDRLLSVTGLEEQFTRTV